MRAQAAIAIFILRFGRLALSKGEEEGEDLRKVAIVADPSPQSGELRLFLSRMVFPFAVVPKAKLCTRTDSAGTAENYAKEFAQKIFRRIHAQFPG